MPSLTGYPKTRMNTYSVWMSQLQKLGKKLYLDKSKQKSFGLRGKQKSSSMQSFTEKTVLGSLTPIFP